MVKPALSSQPPTLAPIYALILTAPSWRALILPAGEVSDPVANLRYESVLTLEDAQGSSATFERKQTVRFLQNGVGGLLDSVWGDGVQLTYYHHTAGPIQDSFKAQGQRHLLIALPRRYAVGEILTFSITREVAVAFQKAEEWLVTTIDRQIEELSRTVIFPKSRPCRSAELVVNGVPKPLPVRRRPDGTTLIRFQVKRPRLGSVYLLNWNW